MMKKSIVLLSGLGISVGALYAIGNRKDKSVNKKSNGKDNHKQSMGAEGNGTSMGHLENGSQAHELDDQGTGQVEASRILRNIRDVAFDSSNENLALALGRPTEEIEGEIDGIISIDGDELLKARKLAMERGVEL
jgi:hypothetical protein